MSNSVAIGNITKLGAAQIAAEIAAGHLSAVEVVEAHIRRIESVNPVLNALVVPLFEQALASAKRADEQRGARAPLGPLHGVPMTLKECIDVQGTPSTWGLTTRAGEIAEHDDPFVTKLREAGAIILGKTNVSQLLMSIEARNPVYGVTNNPWRPQERSSGGSSGGEGALIAAGGSPLGIGTDIGGSVRYPAHFCGIHGLKPTSGRVRMGLTPGISHVSPVAGVMAQPGPLARQVADLGLALRVMNSADQPCPERAEPLALQGMKIGMFLDDTIVSPSPAIRRTIMEAAQALKARGAIIEEFTPPDLQQVVANFLQIMCSDGGQGMLRTLGASKLEPDIALMLQSQRWSKGKRLFTAQLLKLAGQRKVASILLPNVGMVPSKHLASLIAARESYKEAFVTLMQQRGLAAIICPPYPLPALRHHDKTRLTLDGAYALLFNFLQMPAGVVSLSRVRPGEESDRPNSRDLIDRIPQAIESNSAGLPVGVQVASLHWREDIVLAIMQALEEDFAASPDYPVNHSPLACIGN